MTDRDRKALRDALALALYDRLSIEPDDTERAADAILAHPAVAAALAGSGPEAGLREAAQAVLDYASSEDNPASPYYLVRDTVLADLHDALLAAIAPASPTAGSGPEAGLREAADALADAVLSFRSGATVTDLAEKYRALAATPTASPTGLQEANVSAIVRAALSASPTATGERQP